MAADFYDLLGIDEDAEPEELKTAYRTAVRRYHPDVNDKDEADAQFKVVKTAYEVLSNPKERSRYDRVGHRTYVRDHLEGLPTTVVSTVEGDVGNRPGTTPDASETKPKGSSRWDQSAGSRAAGNTESTSDHATTSGHSSTSRSNDERRSAGDATEARATSGRRTASDGVDDGVSEKGATRNGTDQRDYSPNASAAVQSASESPGSDASTTSDRIDEGSPAGEPASGSDKAGNSSSQTQAAGTTTGTRQPSVTERGRRDAHRIGLRRGFGASLIGLLVYLVGIGDYIVASGLVSDAILKGLTTSPVPTLLQGIEIRDPVVYLLASISDPGVALLFGIGLLVLPLTVGTTVLKYGRGVARLYAIAVLTPILWLSLVSESVATVAGVDFAGFTGPNFPLLGTILLLGVIPVGAALAFSIDVARYLHAS